MRVTIAEVARRARVSKATVSRVLNDRGEVDAATAVRVRDVIAATGYTPSAGAVGLARGRTQTVGVLVPGLTRPWVGDVLQGVADVLEARGYALLLHTATRGADSITQFARQVNANTFDGQLLLEPPSTDFLRTATTPTVIIDDRAHHPGFPTVAPDNRAGAELAARHLLAAGRTTPAVITGPPRLTRTHDRSTGFTDAYHRAGHPTPHHVEGGLTREAGHAAVTALLAATTPFDSLFAHDDLTALGALDALREARIPVPTAIPVIGFDDTPAAAHTHPALTTIAHPAREMGETATTLLLRLLAGDKPPTTPQILPTHLVIRETA
ncbi:LacI family DNA-binding transcriptional regulator [Actinokineospora sp. G85]|uniref:LacI family DNA-binding transcriptional regulator n=1 Tax=Actinokineospora sp. G85 TaxID=3406626 RepID=UPI003C767227